MASVRTQKYREKIKKTPGKTSDQGEKSWKDNELFYKYRRYLHKYRRYLYIFSLKIKKYRRCAKKS